MTYFEESQRFRQPLVWLLLVVVAAPMWYGVWRQVVQGRPFGDNPASDAILVGVWLLVGVALPLCFGVLELRTEVRDDGIAVRFAPFQRRPLCWTWNSLQRVYVREYSPLREYGGWGIRFGPGGRAFNVSGRHGVQLEPAQGKGVLIGTQDPAGFMEAVDLARPSSPAATGDR